MKYPARHSAKKLIATKTAQQERSLSVLRLRHGSSSLRRTIRHGLRCDSHLERRSFVIASPDNTQSHDVGSITAKTQAMRLPDHKPGLLRLPLELRQQIYGYLIPFNDQHILQSRGRERYVPNLAGRCPISSDQNPIQVSLCYPREYEPGRAWTAILRLNQRLHCETREYLFRNCTIKIRVDATGYSFLEAEFGGAFVDYEPDDDGIRRPNDARKVLGVRPRDRDSGWHKRFVSSFDFTLPKKYIISIEAIGYENPREVMQIRQNVMSLCDVLRKCPNIHCVEVEPQSQEYHLVEYGGLDCDSTRGSYFVWEWNNSPLPTYEPSFRHKLSRTEQFRLRSDRKAVWGGRLSHLVLKKVPDLLLVLQPLVTLRNVAEASIKLPSTTANLGQTLSAGITEVCDRMKGKTTSTLAKEIEKYDQLTEQCRERLRESEVRKIIKKANRTKAKDMWYWWHCEMRDEEFTEHGEQGYESSDDADW